MSSSVRALMVGMISIGVGLLIAFAIAVIEIATEISLYGLSVAIVIPLGAIGCGVVAAAGFYFASRLLHVRPVGPMLVVPGLTAVVTFVVSHWLTYQRSELPTGKTYAEVMALDGGGFIDYLQVVATESGISSSTGTSATIDRLGSWGYGIVALQIVGFALGGWFVTVVVRNRAWCERCGRFPRMLGKEVRHFAEPSAFEASANRLVDVLERGGPVEAFVYAAAEKPVLRKRSDAFFRVTTEHFACSGCATLHTVISTDRAVDGTWSRLSQTPPNIEAETSAPFPDVLVSSGHSPFDPFARGGVVGGRSGH